MLPKKANNVKQLDRRHSISASSRENLSSGFATGKAQTDLLNYRD